MESYFSFLLLLFSPAVIATGGLWLIRWLDGEHRRKSPVTRKVVRYPGYTLGKEVEELDESMSTDLMMLFLTPAVFLGVIGLGIAKLSTPLSWVFIGVIYAGAVGFFITRLYRTTRKLRMKRLGLSGERLVGHELANLYRSGFYVFHDCPLEFGNIDHIAVGPSGVYAIETKFKRKGKDEKDGHKLSFDENLIYFPEGETSRPIEQASRQADELRALLERMFGVVPVVPVLVYPGWYVTRKSASVSVQVMNNKQLLGWLSKEARIIEDAQVKRISAFIEERCRDVEV